MEDKNYNSNQDYCNSAIDFQSVASFRQYHEDNPDTPIKKINTERASTLYSSPDNYHMGSIQDNQIYIATTDGQHDQIAKGEHVDAHGGLSGFFSDQATIDACKNGNELDNTKYNEMCQIAPHREGGMSGSGDATYKPHVDCFDINRNALHKNYETYDFNAAVAKCEANNQFGAGGGNQGYNPHISEMVDNGSLVYRPDKSYSDNAISESEHNNPNSLSNSVVNENDYRDMLRDSQLRSQDCVNNNTPHPSAEACNNGFEHNPTPIPSETGNARPCNLVQEDIGKEKTPIQKEAQNADDISLGQPSTSGNTVKDGKEITQPPIQKEAANADELAAKNTNTNDNTLDKVADENNLNKTDNTQDNGIKKEQGITQ